MKERKRMTIIVEGRAENEKEKAYAIRAWGRAENE